MKTWKTDVWFDAIKLKHILKTGCDQSEFFLFLLIDSTNFNTM